jgi:hypothetical protein
VGLDDAPAIELLDEDQGQATVTPSGSPVSITALTAAQATDPWT